MSEVDVPSFNQDEETDNGYPAGAEEFCRRLLANGCIYRYIAGVQWLHIRVSEECDRLGIQVPAAAFQ